MDNVVLVTKKYGGQPNLKTKLPINWPLTNELLFSILTPVSLCKAINLMQKTI